MESWLGLGLGLNLIKKLKNNSLSFLGKDNRREDKRPYIWLREASVEVTVPKMPDISAPSHRLHHPDQER